MKELSIEWKAKRYDEILVKLQEAKVDNNVCDDRYCCVIDDIVPELTEYEDERIRKQLLEVVHGFTGDSLWVDYNIHKEDAIEWLEKQGGQKHTAEEVLIKAGLKPYKDGDQWCVLLGDNIQDGICGFGNTIEDALYAFLKDLIASKNGHTDIPADAVLDGNKDGLIADTIRLKPKFKVGDWVVQGCIILKIRCVGNERYCYETVGGYVDDMLVSEIDSLYHLWSIKDAKGGDVLACDDEDKVFIYNGKLDLKGRVCAYCGIYKTYDELRFTECAIGNSFTYKEPHPAAKEQRDLLFQKMKEAGYQWDAEKLELKKGEQKPSDEHYELEEFVRIVRGNLTGISKTVQKLLEAKYLELTGHKMYIGFKD